MDTLLCRLKLSKVLSMPGSMVSLCVCVQVLVVCGYSIPCKNVPRYVMVCSRECGG